MHSNELREIADRYGTPLYLYDLDAIAARASAVTTSLSGSVELYYAVKANPCPALVRSARNWADGLDISSGGELRLSLEAGWDPASLSFAGPGKNDGELDLAVTSGCGSISVESIDDLARILAAGERTGHKPRLSLRVNPRELTGSFALKMGGKPTQFGVDEEDVSGAIQEVARAVKDGKAEYAGLHIYAGTQCLDYQAIVDNVKNSLRIARETERMSGLAAPGINLGGGFGIAYYDGQEDLDLAATGASIAAEVKTFRHHRPETRFIVELGRYLTAPAGWYLSTVLAVKKSRGKVYAILDGGMHQHLSASGNLGQAIKRNFRMRNLNNESGEPEVTELAGCLCTPIDLLGFGVELPQARVGDVICLENSGAYGFSASPLFFLGHDTPKEIAIEHGNATVVREPLCLSDLETVRSASDRWSTR